MKKRTPRRIVRVKKKPQSKAAEKAQDVMLIADATKAVVDVMFICMVFAISFMLLGAGLWSYANLLS